MSENSLEHKKLATMGVMQDSVTSNEKKAWQTPRFMEMDHGRTSAGSLGADDGEEGLS